MKNEIYLVISVLLIFGSIFTKRGEAMELKSSSFEHNGRIPKKFTCQGEDINPALLIKDLPQETKSLALVIDDPDAPMKTWVHWVVFNIGVTEKISENSIPGVQGRNDFRRNNYGGPCPPTGTHRYFFKLYALDMELDLGEGASKRELEEKMGSHILDQCELIGLYKKER